MFNRASALWRKLSHRPAPLRPAAQAVEDDRRVWVRRHVNMETQVTPTSDAGEPSLPARILDVSSGGVKLVVRWAFGPGDLLTVELPSRPGEGPVTVLACVAHSQPEGDTEWVVGCRFSAELGADDLAALGAARSKASASDNRSWSRHPCNVKAVYQLIGEGEDARHEATVLNISPGGVALSVEQDIRAGALLNAELTPPGGRAVVNILACVVHVTVRSKREHILGCNFIQELSEEDLAALA